MWDIVENKLVDSIENLARSGADFAIIPANTVHKVIDAIQQRSCIPVISMLDVVAERCKQLNLSKVGILGTHWTMADHLYEKPLERIGIQEVPPSNHDQQIIQRAIFDELIPHGKASEKTILSLLKIIDHLKSQGCDSIALACTELPLVLNSENCKITVLDTTTILAEAAIKKTVNLMSKNSEHHHLKASL